MFLSTYVLPTTYRAMDEHTAETQSATKESTPANSDRPQNTTSILYDHKITNDGTATKDDMARVQAIFAWDLKHNLKTDWLYIKHHFAEDRQHDIEAIHEDIISQTGTQSDQLDKDYLQGRTMNLSISSILQTRDTLNEVQNTDLMSVEIQNKTLQETVPRQEGAMLHLVEENVRLRLSVDELTKTMSAHASKFPDGEV
jgi:hypothetical protein